MTRTVSPQFRVVVRTAARASSHLQVSDTAARPPGVVVGEADGATWVDAVHSLYARWAQAGGTWLDANGTKQGHQHYGTIVVPDNTAGDRSYPLPAALIQKLLDERNTGLYVGAVTPSRPAPPRFRARWHSAGHGPRLRVTTNAGTFDCPCTVSIWLEKSSENPLGEGNAAKVDYVRAPGILKFDLSGVAGTVLSTTLILWSTGGGSVGPFPFTLSVNYLDMPSVVTNPAVEVGGAREGIASTVSRDSQLRAHPSVLWYHDITDDASITKNYLVTAPIASGGWHYVKWPEYGLSALHAIASPRNQRVVSWWKYGLKPASPPRRLYFRYLLQIDPKLDQYFREAGMKLPGLEGAQFSYRLWHTQKSESNPSLYQFATYAYDVDHPRHKFPGNGEVRFTNGFFLRGGRKYCIEQEVVANTVSPNVLADGQNRVWIDGVLAYENTNARVRTEQEPNIIGIPFINIYHGGMVMPLGPFWYEITGICVATQYIGPPRRIA
jgi:hypothetical protein